MKMQNSALWLVSNVIMTNVVMPSVVYTECRYQIHYAECRWAECLCLLIMNYHQMSLTFPANVEWSVRVKRSSLAIRKIFNIEQNLKVLVCVLD
jgi:hypothetical protein